LGERPADGRVAPAVLNPTALQVLRELDPDGGMGLAKSVMRAFLDGSTKSLQQIDEGLRFADARSLARGAHTLKSSSANAGAHTLSELYGQLERLGREERIEEARALLPQVRLEHEQALAAMHRILHDGA
jgi:HPt (histidine-containing phosphotransfer) domain-containing protein